MSQYYNPKRTRNIFDPSSKEPFKLSRSKVDSFLNCPRCFYRDRRLGLAQPPGFPFNLNSAVDALLKKEFDIYRAKAISAPLLRANNLDLIPFNHENIDIWRENFKGLEYYHEASNFLCTGAVDDIWADKEGLLYIVDYKSTSKEGEVSLDAEWQIAYKKQMEFYQFLLRGNGFKVSDTGYFVYCNGLRDREEFNARLDFSIKIIPYQGDTSWIDETLVSAKETLMSNDLPESGADCDYCKYLERAKELDDLAYQDKLF